MAGSWVITKKNGKAHTTPFTFNAEERDNIAYYSPKGEKLVFVNAVTRRQVTLTGSGHTTRR